MREPGRFKLKRVRRLSPALLAATACAVGFACGEMVAGRGPAPLAPAGSARDDGSGWLARMSSRPTLGRAGDGRPAAGAAYGGARYGGQTYGGGTYGAATYGGALYGNYQAPGVGPNPDPPAPYRAGYTGNPVANGGSVEGSVVWPDAPRAPERISAGRAGCAGGEIPNRTLMLGAGHTVANAVVYLEDITRGRLTLGRTWPYPPTRVHQVGGALEWRGCRLRPHLQLAAPIGALLSVSSSDEALTLAGTRVDGAHREPVFTARLGAAGAAREIQLGRDGFVEVKPEAGGGGGWIVVAPHPYYVVSDERGRFVLDEIPPGTYTLVVWHEPVITGVRGRGELVVTPATVVKRRVTVKAGQRQRLVVRLPGTR
jgi:hypothetical protein